MWRAVTIINHCRDWRWRRMATLGTLTRGDTFRFGGHEWLVLNPALGLICKKTPIGPTYFHSFQRIPETIVTSIVENDTNNIGYMLKRNFYDSLSEVEKSVVLRTTWNVGSIRTTAGGENTATPTATLAALKTAEATKNIQLYVSFLSYTEFFEYEDLFDKSLTIGLRTPYAMDDGVLPTYLWTWYNAAYRVMASIQTRHFYPVMKINTETNIVNGEVSFNAVPTLTPTETAPSGTYSVKPSFDYTVSDADGDTMTITESIDGVVFNTRTGVESGAILTYVPSDIAWLRTRLNQSVNITIKVDDGIGGVTTVNYPITRTTPSIDFQLKTPFETDVAARRLLLNIEGNIPNDAIVSVQACNNAFDSSPTWENATNLILSGFPYPFTNKTKTSSKWGVSFKIKVERGGSTGLIYIDGVGGAFD